MSIPWEVYQRIPGLVLGFHGCDKKVGEKVLRTPTTHLAASNNEWDWLGDGIYFWENDPMRALEFAKLKSITPGMSKAPIKNPFVIGAVIDLGACCNLMDRTSLEEIKRSHKILEQVYHTAGATMPVNKGTGNKLRYLDRAVFEHLHFLRKDAGLAHYDTLRGLYYEGGELFSGAGINSHTHVQIAVRTKSCIKGYFRPFP